MPWITAPRALLALVLIGLGTAVPAHAAPSSATADGPAPVVATVPGGTGLPAADPAVITAMGRDLGLTPAQAEATLAAQARASAVTEPALRSRTGDRFAGAWWEPATSGSGPGGLAVGVTDAALTAEVRAGGARPVLVARTEKALIRIVHTLDGASAAVPKDVTGWYVDLPTNTVVVEALPTAVSAARAFVASVGIDAAAVRVVTVTERPRPQHDITGGDRFNISGGYCSIGFPVTRGFVTAGHCVSPGAPTTGINGVAQGTAIAGVFPGADHGWVETNTDWVPTARVNGYDYGPQVVGGSTEAVVGSVVCGSGARTGWYCGHIQARNVTADYGSSGRVYNLVRASLHSDGGDSGGAVIAGTQAQGVHSGTCGSTCGIYQPLLPILAAYGLTLVTTPVVSMSMDCESWSAQMRCTVHTGAGTAPFAVRWHINGGYYPTLDNAITVTRSCIPGQVLIVNAVVTATNGTGQGRSSTACSNGPPL